jgi:hypothetical protein
MELKLKNIRISFPALGAPQALGDGEPAYGAKFIVEPNSAHATALDDAIAAVAKDQWKDKAENVLAMLREDGKVCFTKREYRSKKTGLPYEGFEGKHYLNSRNAKNRPTVVDRFGNEVTDKGEIERLIYSGCHTHASFDIWAQDNKWGRRINCTLRGVMFAGDGESFGGGSGVASASEFADLAEDAEDLL